jgi:hypothetical protein
MDTRFFGNNLTASSEIRSYCSRRSSREAAEDTYYKRHAPSEGRFQWVASAAAAAVCIGFVANGFWPQ